MDMLGVSVQCSELCTGRCKATAGGSWTTKQRGDTKKTVAYAHFLR